MASMALAFAAVALFVSLVVWVVMGKLIRLLKEICDDLGEFVDELEGPAATNAAIRMNIGSPDPRSIAREEIAKAMPTILKAAEERAEKLRRNYCR